MFKIKALNKISDIIHTQLSADDYMVTAEEPVPDAILVRSANMHEMELPPNLLAIARAGAGVNNIPIVDCSKRGIVVFNTPGANANAVAELVMAGLLMGSRNIAGGIQWAATLKGQPDVPKLVEKGKAQFVGPELRGKTLGVIGLGAIGAIVANAASRGFGMNVIGHDPFISVDHAWSLSTRVHRAASMDEVIQKADYLTIHVPLNDKTRGMVDAAMIAKMKPGAHLLNFSRAELVNSDACLNALATSHLASYVVDFPTDEMLGVANVVAIPHLGASTPESEDNCAVMAANQLKAYLEDGNIINSVNYPDVNVPRAGDLRICVLHRNIPNMLAQISSLVSACGVNIASMTNKSRKDLAYTLLDVEGAVADDVADKIAAIDGVIRVRIL